MSEKIHTERSNPSRRPTASSGRAQKSTLLSPNAEDRARPEEGARRASRRIRALIAAILFLLVFLLLTIPFTDWWFNGCDDFHGLYLGFRTKTWSELGNFFIDGHINQDSGPTNGHYNNPTTFLSTYYRPLYSVFLTLQYWLFGTNAYAYFVCNVFFHAVNTALLFIICSSFTSYLPAFFGSLFFAFHPQVAYRFGAIVNLHYYVNVTLILLTLMLVLQYQRTRQWWLYTGACLLFTCALFTRESSIVLPAIIWLLSARAHKLTYGFLAITAAFLSWRLYLYPFVHSSSHKSISTALMSKSQEFLVFLYDCFGLSWLPWGNKLLRGGLLGALLIFFAWLCINNKKKSAILNSALCAGLMLWPGIIGCYSPRYIYEALPFIIAVFIFCLDGYQGNLTRYKPLLICSLSLFMLFYINFTLECFWKREQKMHTFSTALHTLLAQPITHNRALCFLTYPMDGLGDHPSDIVRVLRKRVDLPLLCDTAGALVQQGSNIITPTHWKNVISSLYTKNYVTVTPVKGGFHFATSDPTKIRFFFSDNQSYSLGKKVSNGQDGFTLLIDEQYKKLDPVFVTWNYETRLFDIVDA